jgi:hypothetical protein
MKFYSQGSSFRVTVSESEVSSFGQNWPCSDLRHGDRASFTFDSKNGDLVDLRITHRFAGIVERDGADVSALADDAKAYGLKRLSKAEGNA